MAITPNAPTKTIFASEDYKDIIKTVPQFDGFIQDLNRFVIPAYNLLNGGLIPQQNTAEEFYQFNFTANGITGSQNTFTFTPRKFVGIPNGVYVISMQPNAATQQVATAAPGVSWIPGPAGTVQLNAIYGMVPNVNYNVTLRIT